MKRNKRFVEWYQLALAVIGVAFAPAAAPRQCLAQATRPPMLVNVATGKAMDVFGAFTDDGTIIQQFTPHGNDNQRWLIRLVAVEQVPTLGSQLLSTHAIIAVHSGRCLDVPNNDTTPGVDIIQFSPHFGANQRWALIPTNAVNEVIIMSVRTGLCLDIEGHSSGDQARVEQQRLDPSSPFQRWRIVP